LDMSRRVYDSPGRAISRPSCWPATTLAGDANNPTILESPSGTDALAIVVEASTLLVGVPDPSVVTICITHSAAPPSLLISVAPRTRLPVLWAVNVWTSRSPGSGSTEVLGGPGQLASRRPWAGAGPADRRRARQAVRRATVALRFKCAVCDHPGGA